VVTGNNNSNVVSFENLVRATPQMMC